MVMVIVVVVVMVELQLLLPFRIVKVGLAVGLSRALFFFFFFFFFFFLLLPLPLLMFLLSTLAFASSIPLTVKAGSTRSTSMTLMASMALVALLSVGGVCPGVDDYRIVVPSRMPVRCYSCHGVLHERVMFLVKILDNRVCVSISIR